MSALYDAAMEAHRALCKLEDELDVYRARNVKLEESERSAVGIVASRWAVDTDRKIKRALDK